MPGRQPLSEADMAEHVIVFAVPETKPKTVKAAYITTEERHPDSYAFHNHLHQTVSLVRREYVLYIDRIGPDGQAEPVAA